MLKTGTVEVPTSRMVVMAKHLGSQDCEACPPVEHECWLFRDMMPYLPGDASTDTECAECWLRYIMAGD